MFSINLQKEILFYCFVLNESQLTGLNRTLNSYVVALAFGNDQAALD